ncbi:LysR substrate-binding domain-containing protein [Streptacidiphilus sp. N1-3]|uniref:LysR substrate-binding domain-containing protein n=1 Tax=Streptacidiphilus alkalitolerans TaxID=3342712 RepID=A0ABV6XA85_9ACTN
MDLRLLRYFVAVAEERNFTTAARRLHVSQPALSQQIKLLERGLDAELLDRSTQPLRLTPAGSEMLVGAYRLLRCVEDVDRTVRATTSGQAGVLRIGTTWGGLYDMLLPAMRALRSDRPDIQLPVTQLGGRDQLAALRRDEIDVMLHRHTHKDSFDGIERTVLFDDPMIAILPLGHPAGRSGRVRLADLADERFVMIGRQVKPLVFDRCVQLCHQAGFEPDVVAEVLEPMALALAVASEGVVSLSGAGMANRYPGLDYLLVDPVVGIAEVSAVWLPTCRNALLEPFLAALDPSMYLFDAP